jgi:hypothetical protein
MVRSAPLGTTNEISPSLDDAAPPAAPSWAPEGGGNGLAAAEGDGCVEPPGVALLVAPLVGVGPLGGGDEPLRLGVGVGRFVGFGELPDGGLYGA